MLNALKQSGARAIGSLNQQFSRSRLMLTIAYTVILAAILLISSGVTISIFFQRLDARFEKLSARVDKVDKGFSDSPRAADLKDDLLETAYLVNGILLLGAAILSYWLAGLTLKPIQQAYDRQRQFLSDVTHELRTPLSILQTNLENDRAEATTDARKRNLASHLEEVDHMSSLIRDLLTLSRLQGDETRIQTMVKADLSAIVSKAVDRLLPIAERHAVKLELTSLPELPQTISMTNDDLLLQAITNLIQNAIVYNKPDGRVTVSVEPRGDMVAAIVEDTGVGISEADQAKIFDRFYRVEKSRSRQTGGSGLGLSIVKSIADVLGGKIEIDSQVGRGTRITFLLPLSGA